jgi:hypothetical protein
MNYLYERMLNESDSNNLTNPDESNQVLLDKKQMAKFEEYVTANYEVFYAGVD